MLQKLKVDIAKCHPCHAKSTGITGTQAHHKNQPSAKSATPATQNGGPCHQVPRLPRKVELRRRDPTATRASPVLEVRRLPGKLHVCEYLCLDKLGVDKLYE